MASIKPAGASSLRSRRRRIAGEIALMMPPADAIKAEGRARRAKSWELRAAMSMARLWRDQGKRDEAHDLLAPVYGWFTEGFDMLDLKEAKALLDEVNMRCVDSSAVKN